MVDIVKGTFVADEANGSMYSVNGSSVDPRPTTQPLAAIAYRRQLEHVPPLSIRYLLLWTATTALALLVFSLLGMEGAALGPWAGILAVLAAIVVGWIWMAMVILGWHFAHKTIWCLEPGEWLLLVPGGAVSLLPVFALLGTFMARDWLAGLLMMWTLMCIGAVGAGAAATSRRPTNWKGIYWVNVFVFVSLVCAMAPPLAIAWLIIPPLAVVFLIRSVYRDRRAAIPRHWLHYSGVVLFGLAFGILLVIEVVGIAGFLLS